MLRVSGSDRSIGQAWMLGFYMKTGGSVIKLSPLLIDSYFGTDVSEDFQVQSYYRFCK